MINNIENINIIHNLQINSNNIIFFLSNNLHILQKTLRTTNSN